MNMAFILLSEAQMPRGEEIVRAFADFGAEGERLRPGEVKLERQAKVEALELEYSPSGKAFVLLMPMPVPKGEADDAARFSISAFGTGWQLPSHTAQLVVYLRDTASQSPSEALSRFTSLLAAVSKASSAVGVYWGNAGATHDAKFFISTAQKRDLSSRILLWTGVSMAREPDGRLSLLSLGMKQLNLPDLLLIAPRSTGNQALSTFFDLLGYVTALGKPLPDGDTVGRTPDERLPVRYVPSPINSSKKVWRVEVR